MIFAQRERTEQALITESVRHEPCFNDELERPLPFPARHASRGTSEEITGQRISPRPQQLQNHTQISNNVQALRTHPHRSARPECRGRPGPLYP